LNVRSSYNAELVTAFDQLRFWQRALLLNAMALIGIYLGFLSSSHAELSVNIKVHIATLTLAFMNFMLPVVAPRIKSQRAAGGTRVDRWQVFYEVLNERFLISVLVIIQLLGVSRTTAAAIVFMQVYTTGYFRTMENGQIVAWRAIGFSALLGITAIFWLIGAVGLWKNQKWAWWLVLALSVASLEFKVVSIVLKLNETWLSIFSIVSILLLLLKPVRTNFLQQPKATRSPAPQAPE
jgi:hypothetical protein